MEHKTIKTESFSEFFFVWTWLALFRNSYFKDSENNYM